MQGLRACQQRCCRGLLPEINDPCLPICQMQCACSQHWSHTLPSRQSPVDLHVACLSRSLCQLRFSGTALAISWCCQDSVLAQSPMQSLCQHTCSRAVQRGLRQQSVSHNVALPGGKRIHFLAPLTTAFHAHVALGSTWKEEPDLWGPMIIHLQGWVQQHTPSTIWHLYARLMMTGFEPWRNRLCLKPSPQILKPHTSWCRQH
jgi:hypothetical protein